MNSKKTKPVLWVCFQPTIPLFTKTKIPSFLARQRNYQIVVITCIGLHRSFLLRISFVKNTSKKASNCVFTAKDATSVPRNCLSLVQSLASFCFCQRRHFRIARRFGSSFSRLFSCTFGTPDLSWTMTLLVATLISAILASWVRNAKFSTH